MVTTSQRTPPMQWVALIFLIAMGAFLAWAGHNSKEGFGAYSTALMGDFALMGMVLRSIFKNTEDDL